MKLYAEWYTMTGVIFSATTLFYWWYHRDEYAETNRVPTWQFYVLVVVTSTLLWPIMVIIELRDQLKYLYYKLLRRQ